MELTKYTLFANHTTTGSVYNTPFYNTENAKSVRFWVEGPYQAGVGASALIAFDHAMYPGGVVQPFTGFRMIGAGGSSAYLTETRPAVITMASGILHSFTCGYVDKNFMPNCLQVRYEISGVAASSSAGTMTAFMAVERETM
jgi:hypothetical protein